MHKLREVPDYMNIFALIFIGMIVVVILVVLFTIIYSGTGKGKERDIVIVRKRKTTRDLPKDPKTTMNYGGKSTYELTNLTVDFRYVGKKHVHTYFIDRSMYKKFNEGHTYRVKLRYPNILEIVTKGKKR